MFFRRSNVFIILSILIGFAPMQYISAEPTEDLLNAALKGDLKKAEAALYPALQGGAKADVNGKTKEKVKSPEYEKNKRDYSEGSTASWEGYLQIVKFLLVNQADVNENDNEGFTALISASYNGHLEIARLPIQNKADVKSKIECERCKDKGKTALMLASERSNIDIVRLLMNNKAD